MTSKSTLIRPYIDISSHDIGRGGAQGQVMAADDEEDDLQWLDDAQLTDDEQNEDEAEHTFPELEMVWTLGCRKEPELPSMGRLCLNVIQLHEYEPGRSHVQCR